MSYSSFYVIDKKFYGEKLLNSIIPGCSHLLYGVFYLKKPSQEIRKGSMKLRRRCQGTEEYNDDK